MRRDVKIELIEQRSLRMRVGGDMKLLRDMVAIFAAEYPVLLEKLQKAIDGGDSSAVEKISHNLKGSLVQLSASTAAEAASRLERLGKLNTLEQAGATLETLRDDLKKLAEALSVVVSEGFRE